MNKLISVIVPCYNCCKTIDRCVNSLLEQSYKNLQIILVNDGSTDTSWKKIEKYQFDYNNVEAYNNSNQGAAEARNFGIKKAKGEFLTFVDSDDALKKDAILHLAQNSKNVDIVISGITEIFEDNKKNYICPKDTEWSKFKYNATAFKLYSRDLILENKINFPELLLNEDTCFYFSALAVTDNISIIDFPDYINYKNRNSITSSKTIFDCSDLFCYLQRNVNLNVFNKNLIYFFFTKTLVQYCIMNLQKGNLSAATRQFEKNMEWLSENYGVKIKFQKGEELKINLIVNLLIFAYKTNTHIAALKFLRKML